MIIWKRRRSKKANKKILAAQDYRKIWRFRVPDDVRPETWVEEPQVTQSKSHSSSKKSGKNCEVLGTF